MSTQKTPGNDDQSACHDLRETALHAGQKVRGIYDKAAHQGRDATAVFEKQVRSKPLEASLIAAGIGFLLGSFLRRRK